MKHLVYLIDGTWQAAHSDIAHETYSNVYQLNVYLEATDSAGNPQIVFYTRGIGSGRGLSKYTGGALADGIDDMIAEVYINICSNYQEGDKIYLFGFSRGGVVARAVAALIDSAGLLAASRMRLFRNAWDYFTGYDRSEHNRHILESATYVGRDIEFLGAFDVVFGSDHRRTSLVSRLRFVDPDLETCVRNAVHIMCLDDKRRGFSPILWGKPKRDDQYLEQIWLPGVHSDVGGVYRENALGMVALLTMVDRVCQRTSLRFDVDEFNHIYNMLKSMFFDTPVVINNELVGIWRYLRRSKRTLVSEAHGQVLHPIVGHCQTASIAWKGGKSLSGYRLHNSFSDMALMDDCKLFPFGDDFID